jgi:ubiquinone/menaquinone biosynthesis C-methylase UbiE
MYAAVRRARYGFHRTYGNQEHTMNPRISTPIDVEAAVRQRYSGASRSTEPSLCCPVNYDPRYLAILPQELIERDYGCGDPSRYVQPGEYVVDLGSGGGKVCYIAAQIVGPQGHVVGVDMNDDMLALARQFQPEITQRLGYDNVRFCKGRIQDLAFDLEKFERYLEEHPIHSANDWLRAEAHAGQLRIEQPMIPDGVADIVVSNCVLNLVTPQSRCELFREIHRVLKPGGRAVISDIVCDEPVPLSLQKDPTLWSGCISGAFLEPDFLQAFVDAGFHGVEILDRPVQPWATVEGIEFRSVTVRALKKLAEPDRDHLEAVLYKGPWQTVVDDEGNVLRRGIPTAVSRRMFQTYTALPYGDQLVPIPPRHPVTESLAKPFVPASTSSTAPTASPATLRVRSPRETKGAEFAITELPTEGCCGGGSC